jgi:hypothetical protein
MVQITKTSAPFNSKTPTADFLKSEIDGVVWQKGQFVIFEQALICACKSPSGGFLPTCKNCGGSGWVFVKPTETKMVIHSMNKDTKFKEWSQEDLGKVSISCLDSIEISYMDRITLKNGLTVYNESLTGKVIDNKIVFLTIYDIEEITYIGLFQGVNLPFKQLKISVDYTYSDNLIILDSKYYNSQITAELQDKSITVRYKHKAQFHVLDTPRDIFVSDHKVDGKRENIRLPFHAIGRRAHYVIDRPNLSGTNILPNT